MFAINNKFNNIKHIYSKKKWFELPSDNKRIWKLYLAYQVCQQKTFNYSWLSCPFILWLNIFTVKKPSKSDNVNLKKNIQFLQLLYENTFSKILFKGKVIECIFDISLLIHDFFFYQCLTTYIWRHHHAVLSITWELPFSFMGFFPSVFKSKFMFSFVHS